MGQAGCGGGCRCGECKVHETETNCNRKRKRGQSILSIWWPPVGNGCQRLNANRIRPYTFAFAHLFVFPHCSSIFRVIFTAEQTLESQLLHSCLNMRFSINNCPIVRLPSVSWQETIMDATPMPSQLCAEWIRNIINMNCILSNVRLHILLYCITQQMAKPINFALTGEIPWKKAAGCGKSTEIAI